LHEFPLGRVNGIRPRVPLQPLRQRHEIRVAIWVLQKCRLPVSTIEDEFGAAHTRCCGGRVVVHDVDQRLQRIPVILLRRLGQSRLQFSSELVGRALFPATASLTWFRSTSWHRLLLAI